ncbi:MAG: hypothetical protein KatS3mg090_0937 [Patescibacteria group bacterium]|nr:MAG: hypothetical protein KatS3mg090_0937 [Patescibacteria group bacterium]
MKNKKLRIIAGPCSIDKDNLKEVYEIASLRLDGKPVIWGTRVVGLKSRTLLEKTGEGMGMDFEAFSKNLKKAVEEKSLSNLVYPESLKLAEAILKKTHLIIATEIMDPLLQLSCMDKKIYKSRVLIWNPAVNQLGWPVFITSRFAKKNNWWLGLKNPKWVGENLDTANDDKYTGITTMEKTWEGLASYADYKSKTILIHRGVDVPEKGKYRNAPVHNIAKRVKQRTGCLLFFDPSHSYGPQMKQEILPATINAMQMSYDNEFLYDGILIEAGSSKTDTQQHISLTELKELVKSLSKFRDLSID